MQEDDLNIDNDDDVEEFLPGDNIGEEDEERVAIVDNEEDIEVFEERDDDGTNDEEASIDETALAVQSDKEEHTLITFKLESVLLIHLSRSQIKKTQKYPLTTTESYR